MYHTDHQITISTLDDIKTKQTINDSGAHNFAYITHMEAVERSYILHQECRTDHLY